MSEDLLITALRDGVLTLTLNRPASRNALSLQLVRQLRAALERFIADADARAAVLTGAAPAFCAGLDLRDFSAPDSPRAEVAALINSIPQLPKPIIAAVNGAAMTGGLELVLGCDFALASEQARFGDTHLKIGALSGSGMNSRLPHAVGLRWAKQMVLACQPIDAPTALRIGLVNEVLPAEQLLPRALALARDIAGWDASLAALARDTLGRCAAAGPDEAPRLEAEALAARKARSAMGWSPSRQGPNP
ncbi:MAG TPA: enoyl-CoA hydratase-related protein [Nevskia sp.]|nr:enoyl-CoA hydratase-related protein [Nevskia sp.]